MGLADRDYMRVTPKETTPRKASGGRLPMMQRMRFVWWRLRQAVSNLFR